MKSRNFIKVFCLSVIWTIVFLGLAGFSTSMAQKQDPQIMSKIEAQLEKTTGGNIHISLTPGSGSETNETWKFDTPTGIEIKSVNADIEIVEGDGEGVLLLASGRLRKETSPSLLETQVVNGKIQISQPGTVRDVKIKVKLPKNYAGDLTVETVSGEVGIQEVSLGKFAAKSISGDITGNAVSASQLTVKTVSGDIELQNKTHSNLDISTTSGDVALKLLPSNETEFHLNTTSGDIKNRMSGARGGKYSVTVNTTSGDIEIN